MRKTLTLLNLARRALDIAVAGRIGRHQFSKKVALGLAVGRAVGDLEVMAIFPRPTKRNCLSRPDELPCMRSRIIAWREAAI